MIIKNILLKNIDSTIYKMFLNFCAQTFKWFISFCYWRETFGDVVRSPQLAHFYTRPWGREVWVPPEMGIGGWAAHTKHTLSLSLSLSDNSTN